MARLNTDFVTPDDMRTIRQLYPGDNERFQRTCCTIFGMDIPEDLQIKMCNLVFEEYIEAHLAELKA